jgi:hypothetical protein
VDEYGSVSSCTYPRGHTFVAEDQDAAHLARIAAIDEHVTAAPGEVCVDGTPVARLGPLFGSRADVIASLYRALLEAQEPSPEERHALSVAAHFSEYLADARARKIPSDWVETGTDCGACHRRKLCTKRRCNGVAGKKPVWHDKTHVLMTCPVLAFTPETERVLQLFSWTHELSIEGPGVLRYRRIGLPAGPALGDQEAWTLEALVAVRNDYNEMLAERAIAERARG